MVKEQIVTETRSADERTVPTTSVAARIVWFIAGVIIALLVLRLVLLMLAANDNTSFVSGIYALSAIFAAPFFGIFNYQPTYGEFTFEVSTVVAIIVYALVAWGIARLVTITRPNSERE